MHLSSHVTGRTISRVTFPICRRSGVKTHISCAVSLMRIFQAIELIVYKGVRALEDKLVP
jgi:hypothetical protein